MEVLFIGSVFAKENQEEIIKYSKRAVEFSANVFQEKLIEGFSNTCKEFKVVSAVGISNFPFGYKKLRFSGFKKKQNKYEYVKFNNLWGLRNFSRAKAIKKSLKFFIKKSGEEKFIIVYSAHTPFLDAAVYAKKKDPNIKICLIVPDLPQFMNFEKKQKLFYRLGKKYDVKKFNNLSKNVDAFVLLTEHMKESLCTGNRPCIITEGIIDSAQLRRAEENVVSTVQEDTIKRVVYTGKMDIAFGIEKLIKAFRQIKDEDCRLILCGAGTAFDLAKQSAIEDERITCLGQVVPEVARQWIDKADVLVNPRPNDGEYVKYSFPSKTIEYLLSGKAVVGYKLDGMKELYRRFIFVPENDHVDKLGDAIKKALYSFKKSDEFLKYAKNNLYCDNIAENIIKMMQSLNK